MSTPGYGARARVISPTSGREWFGEVLVWGPAGAPFLRDAETAETRWFPASWVASVMEIPSHDYDAGPCPCIVPTPDEEEAFLLPYTDPACPHHGDPEVIAAAILKKARPHA